MRQLRVGHFGTGHTGKIALAQLLRSPQLTLSGHLVHSPDKAGRDSGEIIGLAPVGVLATDDIDAFLAHDCDCVTYLGNVSGARSHRGRRPAQCHPGHWQERRHSRRPTDLPAIA